MAVYVDRILNNTMPSRCPKSSSPNTEPDTDDKAGDDSDARRRTISPKISVLILPTIFSKNAPVNIVSVDTSEFRS